MAGRNRVIQLSEISQFHQGDNLFDKQVLTIRIKFILQVVPEKTGDTLPEGRSKPALEFLDNIISGPAGLPVNQFDQHLPVRDGHLFKLFLILSHQLVFNLIYKLAFLPVGL